MRLSIVLILSFTLLSCLILLSPVAGILHYLFPAMAVVTGSLVIRVSSNAYISFTLWLYLLTPCFRRLVDFRSSYVDPSPILLTPFLVTALAGFMVLRRPLLLWTREYLPYLLVSAVILYGMTIGALINPGIELVKSGFVWLIPLIWGLYLLTLDQSREKTRKLISVNMRCAAILLGVYGISQYLSLPPWDLAWLEHIIEDHNILSVGNLATGQIRIWSTINGPAVFGNFQMAFLLIAAADVNLIGSLAIVIGGLSFLLAQMRSTWLGACVGLVCLFAWQRRRRLRLVSGVVVVGIVLVGLTSLSPFQEAVATRIGTLSSGQDDGSLQERKATQERLVHTVETHPFGLGLAAPVGKDTNDNAIDSGIFLALVSVGWLGALVLWASLGVLFVGCFKDVSASTDLCIGFRVIVVACLIQMPFADMYSGPGGFILWTAIALADLTSVRGVTGFTRTVARIQKNNIPNQASI